jgi:stage IV sporulation protein FB
MQSIMSWSLPVTRIAGITVRLHLFFLLYMVGMIGRAAKESSTFALETSLFVIMLFVIVLLHELGHCFAARSVGGSADEIMLWPLGGLAYVNHPHNAWASFITTAGGPAVNLVLYLISGAMILALGYWPPLNPFAGALGNELYAFGGGAVLSSKLPWYIDWTAKFFYLNWFLFWFNVLCVGFPLDGGRLLQAALWPKLGYYTATKAACYAGFGVAILLAIWAFVFTSDVNYQSAIIAFSIAIFIFVTCQQELQRLEAGILEDDNFGYDFSQGYTSLERSAGTKHRRPSFFQRWMAERAERKRQREEEERLADEARVDELLDKMREGGGLQALTSEEKRFMNQMSAKLRQRKRSS